MPPFVNKKYEEYLKYKRNSDLQGLYKNYFKTLSSKSPEYAEIPEGYKPFRGPFTKASNTIERAPFVYKPKRLSNKVYRSIAQSILNKEVNPKHPYSTYYDNYTTSDGTKKSILSLAGLHLQQNRNTLQDRYKKEWKSKHPNAPEYDEIPVGYKFDKPFTMNSIGQYIKSNVLPVLKKKYPNLNRGPLGVRKSLVDFEYQMGATNANKFKNMQKALRGYSDVLGNIKDESKNLHKPTLDQINAFATKARNEMLYRKANPDGTYTLKSRYYKNFPKRALENANRILNSAKRISMLRSIEKSKQYKEYQKQGQ